MKEKDFLKEHPSLKGKICTPVGDMNEYPDSEQPIECHYVDLEQLHETQIDKQKVKKVIEKYIKEKPKGVKYGLPINPFQLLKELGL